MAYNPKHQRSTITNLYSTTSARSDTTNIPRYFPTSTSTSTYSFSKPSFSLSSSADFTASTPASSLWPSFDLSSSLSKRPSPALYNQSPYGAYVIGQNEAWLMSDTLAKRPKLESPSNLPVYPQRPGEKDCSHYMLTRTCRFGDSCKFDHPIWVPAGGIPDWKELPSVAPDSNPERPGEPDCPYFLKTQKCKFGLNCKFNHPKDKLSTTGENDTPELPDRPSEPVCSFYVKTGKCKFGATCKFHHPRDIQMPSNGQDATNRQQNNSVGSVGLFNGNAVKSLVLSPPSSFNSKGLPIRMGEEDCPFYLKTGSCKYAANCRYNHPDRNAINPPAAAVGHSVLTSPIPNLTVGVVNPAASIFQSLQPSLSQTKLGPSSVIYPQRPGQSECDFYMKTGVCKFEDRCKFHHPMDRSAPVNVKLTLAGFPRREGVEHCPFYMKTGTCKYGATCRFDHPPPGEVIATSGKERLASAEEEAKEDAEEKPDVESTEEWSVAVKNPRQH